MSSVFNKKSSNFEELLELDEFVSVHTRNLQTLATKLFKVSKNIAPKILKDIFSLSLNTEYNLRHQSQSVCIFHWSKNMGYSSIRNNRKRVFSCF